MVRVPQACNFNEETTVLAHYRLAGISGGSLKPPDICGAWCCSSCHLLIDGQAKSNKWSHNDLRLMHAEGVIRTLDALNSLGVIKTSGR
jgi:hypothetical protein